MILTVKKSICIIIILVLLSCTDKGHEHDQDVVVFESDTRGKNIGFKPTSDQIDQAESRLVDYLETQTELNQTIYIENFGKKVPLQDRLKFYKKRYFGAITHEGEKIITTEFVFGRCGGHEEWRKIGYTNHKTKSCWWSVRYSLKYDRIYDLKF